MNFWTQNGLVDPIGSNIEALCEIDDQEEQEDDEELTELEKLEVIVDELITASEELAEANKKPLWCDGTRKE